MTICTKFYQWVNENVTQQIQTWVSNQQEECKQYPWWDPRGLVCWIVTILVSVITTIIVAIPVLIATILCFTLHIIFAAAFKPPNVPIIIGELSTYLHQIQMDVNGLFNLFKENGPNPISKDGWELVFNDEFNDPLTYNSTLFTNKWNTETFYGMKYNPENIINFSTPPKEYFSEKNFEFTGNSINLIAKRESIQIQYIQQPLNVNWGNFVIDHTIGQIDSLHSWPPAPQKYERTYGYFEIRCKMPDTRGMWPAFWLYGQAGDEIDIVEYYTGKNSMKSTSNYHYHRNGIHEHGEISSTSPVGPEKFHIYALLWDNNVIEWYYDNMLIRTMPNIGYHNPMHIIIQTAVDDGPGRGLSSANFPNNFEVDYVRVYKKI